MSDSESAARVKELLKLAGLLVATLLLAMLLAEAYLVVERASGEARWVAAIWVHAVLAGGVIALRFARGEREWLTDLMGVRDGAPRWLAAARGRAYLPAGLVIAGAGGLVLISTLAGGARVRSTMSTHIAWIFVVPVVEELVFRGGVGPLFRRLGGAVWGSWFSAVLFALVHANPTWERLIQGQAGIPLGPLLLGFATEALVVATGRIAPAIALHAACNATVAIFAFGDERWLSWLDFLYQ